MTSLIDDVKKQVKQNKKGSRDPYYLIFFWIVLFFWFYAERGYVIDYWVYGHYWIVNVLMGFAMFYFIYRMMKYFMDMGGEHGWW